jgi:hypothetical protein
MSARLPFTGPRLRPVRRIPAPAIEDFERQVVKPFEPVVLEGLIADWPALRHWNIDAIMASYGDCAWNVIARRDGRFAAGALYSYDNPVPVREHLSRVLRFETEDYMNVPFEALPPELATMAPPLRYSHGASFLHRAVFIGSEINGAPFHFHLCQNVLAQISGRKRVLLFHPVQGTRLGWRGPFSKNPNFSPMDPFEPEPRYQPGYARASGFSIDLEPGDALYIPYGWWHATKTLTPSISLFNRWTGGRSLPVMLSQAFDRAVAALRRRRRARPQ